jgi:hypothetical protein
MQRFLFRFARARTAYRKFRFWKFENLHRFYGQIQAGCIHILGGGLPTNRCFSYLPFLHMVSLFLLLICVSGKLYIIWLEVYRTTQRACTLF